MDISFKLSLPNDILLLLTIIATILGIFRGLQEYVKQGREKRARTFFELEKEFFDKEITREICKLLENDNIQLQNIIYEEKINFLGFFEKIALLINSDLIKEEVASYVYGFYVIKCYESINFWSEEMEKDSQYWRLFHSFALRMKSVDVNCINVEKLRL